jgi:hypothetical protein
MYILTVLLNKALFFLFANVKRIVANEQASSGLPTHCAGLPPLASSLAVWPWEKDFCYLNLPICKMEVITGHLEIYS